MPLKPIEVFQCLKPEIKRIALSGMFGDYRVFVGFKKCIPRKAIDGYICSCAKSSICHVMLSELDIDYTGSWEDSLVERPHDCKIASSKQPQYREPTQEDVGKMVDSADSLKCDHCEGKGRKDDGSDLIIRFPVDKAIIKIT